METEHINLLNAIETVLWNSDEEIWLDFDIRINKPRFKKYSKEKKFIFECLLKVTPFRRGKCDVNILLNFIVYTYKC